MRKTIRGVMSELKRNFRRLLSETKLYTTMAKRTMP